MVTHKRSIKALHPKKYMEDKTKGIRDIIEATLVAEDQAKFEDSFSKDEIESMIIGLESAMILAAEGLDFEKAAELRDKILELKKMN